MKDLGEPKQFEPERISLCAWQREGVRRFGSNIATWRFKCPSCGQIQTGDDYRRWGAPIRDIDRRLGFSCIGRTIAEANPSAKVVGFMEPTQGFGCDYAGGGLFRINPLHVIYGLSKKDGEEEIRPTFAFADEDPT